MKLYIDNNLLAPVLTKLCSVVTSVDLVPAAAMLFLETSDKKSCRLTTTSLEMEMTCSLSDVRFDQPGSFLLPAKRLLEICMNSPADTQIEIDCNGKQANIKTPAAKFRLNALPADDFPLLEKSSTDSERFFVRQDDLKFLFDKTADAMADNDILHVLNGALFQVLPEALAMIATDRHRLAFCQIPASEKMSEKSLILPKKAVLELQKLLNDSDKSVEIDADSKYLEIKFEDTTVKTKLLEGDYPDYQQVIPSEFTHSISVDVQAFKQTLTRALIVLRGEKKSGLSVRVVFSNNQVKVSATNTEGEEVESIQEIAYEGPDVEVGFNPQYLNDLLKVASSGEIIFDIKDANSGVLIREKALDSVKYVIMPVRL